MRASSVALLSFAAAVAGAQSVPVEKYKLPNGLTVILHRDATVPVATINLWYRVGSKDEPDRRSGFAHLFEHLMFMGTKRVPNGRFDTIMENAGGSNNATTAEDRTDYYSVGPSNLLPTLLWLDADRLESLGEDMDAKKVDLQRDVVKNERRQSYENAPYGKAYEALNSLLYPAGHPYSWSVIGSMEDLSAASVDDVKRFFATYYVPNNLTLVVAGDFDPATIKPVIASLYGTLPRGDDPPRRAVPPILPLGVKRVTMTDEVPAAKTIFAWHVPPMYKEGYADADLAARVLGDGPASRLYQRLVVKDGLASEVTAYVEGRALGSVLYVEATAAPGVAPEKVEAAVDETIRTFQASGPTRAELDRVRAGIARRQFADLQDVERKAYLLNEFEFYLGEPDGFARVRAMYDAATPESVRSRAIESVSLWNRLVLRVVPRQTLAGPNPRDAQPTIGPPSPFQPTMPGEFALSNGVRVRYWQRADVPLTRLTLLFDGGADRVPGDRAGLARIAADLLAEGTRDRDAERFSNALETLGADLSFDARGETSTATLDVATANLDPALALMREALYVPRNDEAAFRRVRDHALDDVRQAAANPVAIARNVAYRELFGPGHPAGRVPTPETIGAVTRADAVAFQRAVFAPGSARIYAAGSLPVAQFRARLERVFGDAPKAPAPVVPAYAAVSGTPGGPRVFLVDRPGAAQTAVYFLAPGAPVGDPRRVPLEALGTVLGGSFTSRLNQNLRERNGYTYGAGASYDFSPAYGTFSARSSLRTDVTGAGLREFLAEFDRIRKGDVSPEESAKAGATLRSAAISRLATLEGLVDTAVEYAVSGQTFAALSADLSAFDALTPALLNTEAARGVNYAEGVLVLVGDAAKIRPQLAGLGLPEPVPTKAPGS